MMPSHVLRQKENNYLHTICDHCKKNIFITVGSIIVGNKWYHENCFDNIDLASNNSILVNDHTQHNAINRGMHNGT